MADTSMFLDIFKAAIGPIAAVGVAGAVGHQLSLNWAIKQKRREQGLAAKNQFYELYGDFFALMKFCNFVFRDHKEKIALEKGEWLKLVERITSLEAKSEALVMRLASEVDLIKRKDGERKLLDLGQFRQAIQLMRIQATQGKVIGWNSSEHPQYVRFKELSTSVADLVRMVGVAKEPNAETASQQLLFVTNNRRHHEWRKIGRPGSYPADKSVETDEFKADEE